MKITNLKFLKIDGMSMPVILVRQHKELNGPDTWGIFDASKNSIEIYELESNDRQLQILFHEIFHAISYHRCFGMELSETQTQSMAIGLLQVLLDNPQLVKLLIKEKKK